MKRFYFLIGAVSAMFILSAAASAQMVGGYRVIAADDAAAARAGQFAVSAQAEATGGSISLISIHKAERQTVAGANYRLCMNVNVDGAETFVQAVVYVDLKGNYKLTSWKESDCGGN